MSFARVAEFDFFRFVQQQHCPDRRFGVHSSVEGVDVGEEQHSNGGKFRTLAKIG